MKTDAEFMEALKNKLLREAYEVNSATPENLMVQLVDVAEVLETILSLLAVTPESLRQAMEDKEAKRGAFKCRIFLEEIHDE
jgi:predicted house-cleaning noncanonical NTP pyrophosphatase (MazG superfamily)